MFRSFELAHDDETGRRDTSRLEAFSDGVIAIAITVLIIDVHVPTPPAGQGWDSTDLLRGLLHLWPNYLGFVISFLTIGIMWINHHNIFRLIYRTDHQLTVLNTLLLMMISFIPFPTAVVAEYLGEPGERMAVVFYGASFTVTAVFFYLVWWYPTHDRKLVDPAVPQASLDAVQRRFRVGSPIYLACTLIALLSPNLAMALLLGLALFFVLPGRR